MFEFADTGFEADKDETVGVGDGIEIGDGIVPLSFSLSLSFPLLFSLLFSLSFPLLFSPQSTDCHDIGITPRFLS